MWEKFLKEHNERRLESVMLKRLAWYFLGVVTIMKIMSTYKEGKYES